MNESNIVLIGMPGAGKSTIGVLLAKALMMPFIDTDLHIQQREKMFLQDIINKYGLERFLAIEEEIILQLNVSKCLLATGGSVVYSEAAMHHLKKLDSIIVYLQLGFKEVESRIKNISSRGIAMDKRYSLEDLYRERVPLYEKYADVSIDCSVKSMEDIVKEIKDKF